MATKEAATGKSATTRKDSKTAERNPWFIITVHGERKGNNKDNDDGDRQQQPSTTTTTLPSSNGKKTDSPPDPASKQTLSKPRGGNKNAKMILKNPQTKTTTSCTTSSSNNSNNNKTLHVLVIAHPDDESMFFLPTIQGLRDAGETLWIVCLTTGNYDGLGETRKGEMSRVCTLLQIDRLIHLDVEEVQDHPTKSWPMDVVSAQIERALSMALRHSNTPTTTSSSSTNNKEPVFQRVILITFDVHGVSGHINHRDTYFGVRNLVLQQQQQKLEDDNKRNNSKKKQKQQQQHNQPKSSAKRLPPLEAWKLETVHFLPLKYLPVIEWCLLFLSMCCLWTPTYMQLPQQQMFVLQKDDAARRKNTRNKKQQLQLSSLKPQQQQQEPNQMVHIYRHVDFRLSWKAMATHTSQFVWYRRLFVIFSCYTFVNKLRPVVVQH